LYDGSCFIQLICIQNKKHFLLQARTPATAERLKSTFKHAYKRIKNKVKTLFVAGEDTSNG
jgi:hypothetical protein